MGRDVAALGAPVGGPRHVAEHDRDQGIRQPTFLPADYVAAHAEYGWASTITSAQGATVDVGIVLVRPGLVTARHLAAGADLACRACRVAVPDADRGARVVFQQDVGDVGAGQNRELGRDPACGSRNAR